METAILDQINKSGVKKSWLAEKICVSNIMLSHWLNGTRSMPDDKKKEIKSILTKLNEIA